jgi:ACS family tartrate transporter-like MFS transporter
MPASALDRARRKAYLRLIPVLFVSYVVAYVDRSNVAIAKLTMTRDLPGFDNAVIGFGAGIFFLGYFLLEIPGTLIVEKWSARKWISRIMVSWGIMAAATALVTTPMQFYVVRFLLGLAEAGFFPGVIVYLTHWFPARDRARALAYFLVATPVAQIVSPKISSALLKIGTDERVNGVLVHRPEFFGLEGWQCVYIFWGIPAVVIGVLVLFLLKDHPRDAAWLTAEERDALVAELARSQPSQRGRHRMTVIEALRHPKVILLALAYFFVVTGTYGLEFFLPSILDQWYKLKLDTLTWLVMLPPLLALVSQLFIGWSSDRMRERKLHALVPIAIGASMLALVTQTHGELPLTIVCFMVAFAGFKGYLPAFWSLPNLILSEAAAAGAIGMINSVGNLGGFLGPYVIGTLQNATGSFEGGLLFLAVSTSISAAIILFLSLGDTPAPVPADLLPQKS